MKNSEKVDCLLKVLTYFVKKELIFCNEKELKTKAKEIGISTVQLKKVITNTTGKPLVVNFLKEAFGNLSV